jgi:RNA polymerase sigma-70 factor (ECF subfamily)
VKDSFEGNSKFSTYLYSIVYNTSVDYYKRFKKKTFNIVSIDVLNTNYKTGDELLINLDENKIDKNIVNIGTEYQPEKKLNESEVYLIITQYIKNIPEHYSVILNMFYINELSHEEISKILNIPIGTIKNRIFRAKEKLKELLLKRMSAEELLEYV